MFRNVPTGQAPYTLWSESMDPDMQFSMEEDTLFNVGSAGGPGDMSGGTFDAKICPLGVGSGCATFALKYEENTVSGTVRAADGTSAEGMQVRVLPASRTLQPRPTDTTVVVSVAGAYHVTSKLRDGDYTASILHDSVTAGGDSVWASLSFPSSIAFDSEGPDDVDAAVNFTVVRMDTQIQGVVVNDRDADENTVDPGEGLASVTVELYRDGSGAIELDTLVATTTTDANGSYEFSKLAEGTYAVKVLPVAGSVILRKFTALGAIVDTAIVHTMAELPLATANLDNVRRVGNKAPNPLPRWDYDASTQLNGSPSHFTFLYSTGTVTGRVSTFLPGDTSIVNMTMTLNRCLTSDLVAGRCLMFFPGFTPMNVNTLSTGTFTFGNLQEGQYEVTSNPATVGRPSTMPSQRLFTILGNNDVETGNFLTPSP